MSLKFFEKLNTCGIKSTARYVLIALSILADDYGRIPKFNARKLEEFCDLGPRTIRIALKELRILNFLRFETKNFIWLFYEDHQVEKQ